MRERTSRTGVRWGSVRLRAMILIAVVLAALSALLAQFSQRVPPGLGDPAVDYYRGALSGPITRLNQDLADGAVKLEFSPRAGYLASVLQALDVPVESQIAVFSKTSLQSDLIEPANPRTIFFNDRVAVAWMYGGFIEAVSHDPLRGPIFYTLQQHPTQAPRFVRNDSCLRCHQTNETLGIPGMLVRSILPGPGGDPMLLYGSAFSDHRTPIEKRWGGWYVTGGNPAVRHRGNVVVADRDAFDDDPDALFTPEAMALDTLDGRFDTSRYLSPYSDIAALLVFDHQMHMMNLITRIGWETRTAEADQDPGLNGFLNEAAEEFVDYMLFVDEAELPAPVGGASGFQRAFAARGPRDRKGRSLRDLNLKTRLFEYPLSYMIYSQAFDAIPDVAREAIYRRLWAVLSGEVEGARYERLTADVRASLLQILRETKSGLPAYLAGG